MSHSAVVSAPWLKEQLDAGAKVRVLDVSISKGADYHQKYSSSHIPGAQYFNILQDVETSTEFPWNIPTAAAFQKQSRDVGIDDDTHVVVYDNTGNCGFFFGSRAWWLFRLFGHQQVSVLEGGMASWCAAPGAPSYGTSTLREDVKAGTMTAQIDERLIQRFEGMVANLSDKTFQVVDTRPPGGFNGSEDDPKSGHYPGAKNIPFGMLLDRENTRIKSKEELITVFTNADVDVTKPLTVTCSAGMSSCSAALASYICGNETAAVYLGSFSEWKNRAAADQFERA